MTDRVHFQGSLNDPSKTINSHEDISQMFYGEFEETYEPMEILHFVDSSLSEQQVQI